MQVSTSLAFNDSFGLVFLNHSTSGLSDYLVNIGAMFLENFLENHAPKMARTMECVGISAQLKHVKVLHHVMNGDFYGDLIAQMGLSHGRITGIALNLGRP